MGFLGGIGGGDFALAVDTTGPRCPAVSNFVSVAVRRMEGIVSGPSSSDDDKSIRLETGSGGGAG